MIPGAAFGLPLHKQSYLGSYDDQADERIAKLYLMAYIEIVPILIQEYRTDIENDLWNKECYPDRILRDAMPGCSPIVRAMRQSRCVWPWAPASFRLSTVIPTKKPLCRFRRIRICNTSVVIPATTMNVCHLTRLSWCTSALPPNRTQRPFHY